LNDLFEFRGFIKGTDARRLISTVAEQRFEATQQINLEVIVMKSLTKAVAIAALIAAPLAAFAQSSQPVTRAQVREELVQLHNAGYSPLDDRNSYPVHIQAAEARIAAQNAAAAQQSGYGGSANSASQSGAPVDVQASGLTFSHH
jgi:hypothetical protein